MLLTPILVAKTVSLVALVFLLRFGWHMVGKKIRLAGPQDARRDALAESFTRDFEDELDSRDWQANFHPNTETKF